MKSSNHSMNKRLRDLPIFHHSINIIFLETVECFDIAKSEILHAFHKSPTMNSLSVVIFPIPIFLIENVKIYIGM